MTLIKSLFAITVVLTLAACEMPAHDDAARHAEGGGMMNEGEVMMEGGEVMLGDG